METLWDYLETQGDVPFFQSDFNEVDNLILSYLAYVNLDGIVPPLESVGFVTVRQANQMYFAGHNESEILASKSRMATAPLLLKMMARGRRFQNARISKYVNEFDVKEQKQFAAMLIELDDQTVYVAFRGTDDSLISWHEDLI